MVQRPDPKNKKLDLPNGPSEPEERSGQNEETSKKEEEVRVDRDAREYFNAQNDEQDLTGEEMGKEAL